MSHLSQQRMEKIIFAGFKQLLLTQQFSDISIKMIANQSIVHRNTVYHHFTDKFDLLNHYINYEIQNQLVNFDDFDQHPFKSLHDLITASLEEVVIYQQHDHDFNIIVQNCFLRSIVNSQADEKIFWYIGKVTSILLWNSLHHDHFDLLTDYKILDEIYQTSKFPEIE